MNRLGDAVDIARAALFLGSDLFLLHRYHPGR
jgi:hypothetical protein